MLLHKLPQPYKPRTQTPGLAAAHSNARGPCYFERIQVPRRDGRSRLSVGFVGSQGDVLELLEFAEEVLDQLTPFVPLPRSSRSATENELIRHGH
jgi:hypothetical protein